MLPAVCPADSTEKTLEYNSGDFTVMGLGPFGGISLPDVAANSAVAGSNQSVVLTRQDSIMVKPFCPDAFVVSATVTVTRAIRVDILYLDGDGTVLANYSVSARQLLGQCSPRSRSVLANYSVSARHVLGQCSPRTRSVLANYP